MAVGLAAQLASALDVDGPSRAEAALQSMEEHPAVEFAALYSRSGELVARFVRGRPGDVEPPPRVPLEIEPGGSEGSGNLFQLPVKHYGSQVGLLLLRVDLAAENRAVVRSAWVFAGLLLLAGLSAYPTGLRLMGSIAAPIEGLDKRMRQDSTATADRPPARETGLDELDALVAGFDSLPPAAGGPRRRAPAPAWTSREARGGAHERALEEQL